MDLFNVIIRCYDEDEYEELVTRTPVSYREAVSIDRGIEINLGSDYFTEIVEVK